jgi:steroid delta-isomerase
MIRRTIAAYQRTFSANDRTGWLRLFTEDAVLEDPVGTHHCRGVEALGRFWDDVHDPERRSFVEPVTSPAVCGLEAAWAFEVHVVHDDTELVIPVIDVCRFAEDGRIVHNRAFWEMAGARRVRGSADTGDPA